MCRKRVFFEYPHSFTSCFSCSNPDNCIDIASLEQPTSDLYKAEVEKGVQVSNLDTLFCSSRLSVAYFKAIAEKVNSSSQTEWLKPCNKAVQYEPQTFSPSQSQALLGDPSMMTFLDKTIPRYCWRVIGWL